MRPVERGDVPKDDDGNDVEFCAYADARVSLISRIGDFCSYCEVALHSGVHIEHVKPKSKNAELEKTWTNFLLACDYCNPTKGDADVVLDEYLWPDCDNTARAFLYALDRAAQVDGALNVDQREKAHKTIELIGLDREPGHPRLTNRDRRWLKRKEAWGVALIERRNIEENDTPQQRKAAVMVAVSRGYWSVWMAVFHDDVDMRQRLIQWFAGTAGNCFDAETRPVPRSGGQV